MESLLPLAFAIVAAGAIGVCLGLGLRRTARLSVPAPSRRSRVSLHAELILVRNVPREHRSCGRCGFMIRHEREGDLCWMAVRRMNVLQADEEERTRVVHYHRKCADERGEPLPI